MISTITYIIFSHIVFIAIIISISRSWKSDKLRLLNLLDESMKDLGELQAKYIEKRKKCTELENKIKEINKKNRLEKLTPNSSEK